MIDKTAMALKVYGDLGFKRFTEGDWDTYSGAKRFNNGMDPLIA